MAKSAAPAASSYWIYKCKREETSYSKETGDWERWVFTPWKPIKWGTVGIHRGLGWVSKGDVLLCQQSDDPGKTLVGTARVLGLQNKRLLIQAEERIGASITQLKKSDKRIAALKALQGGPIQTVYKISRADAEHLLEAARIQVANPHATKSSRWKATDEQSVKKARDELKDLPAGDRAFVLREIRRVIRDARLRDAVLKHWPAACAACGVEIEHDGRYECHVAHVRDVHQHGADQIRNAVPLCRTHHWAFDAHIWAIRPSDFAMIVRKSLRTNTALRSIHGKKLRLPETLPDTLIGNEEMTWRWKRFKNRSGSDL